MKKFLLTAILFLLSDNVYAETCPDAKVLGSNIVTNVDWASVFPMRFAGATLRDDLGWIPDGAYNGGPVCSCPDRFGVPEFGVPSGIWEPSMLIEVTSKSFCSSVAGGVQIGPSISSVQDSGSSIKSNDSKGAFYEYIQWSFPILKMTSMLTLVKCNNGLDYTDVDVISPSSVLPTWRNEPLAFFANPLSVLFANPISYAVAAAECTSLAFTDSVMNSWPGVAGCWGNIYPLSGNVSDSASNMTAQSLLATKALAFSVGVGLEKYTVGSKAMCEAEYNPNLIKDRFKFSLFYPKSESGNHPIGKPTLLWGEWLNKFQGADSYVNQVNKYGECCLRR